MNDILGIQTLNETGIRVAVVSAGGYALPVRFTIRNDEVEFIVPTWTGLGDRLEELGEAVMVVVEGTEPCLRWLFIRGKASLVANPVHEELRAGNEDPDSMQDLYQVIRIKPGRMEQVDEGRGWGVRETMDF